MHCKYLLQQMAVSTLDGVYAKYACFPVLPSVELARAMSWPAKFKDAATDGAIGRSQSEKREGRRVGTSPPHARAYKTRTPLGNEAYTQADAFRVDESPEGLSWFVTEMVIDADKFGRQCDTHSRGAQLVVSSY